MGRANPSEGSVSYQTNPSGLECLDSSVAGPEGFEPSTVPRTRLVGSFFRLRASASLSLLLYLAEPPGQTLPPGQTFDDPAYGPRRPAKCAATRRFLIKIVGVFASTSILRFEEQRLPSVSLRGVPSLILSR